MTGDRLSRTVGVGGGGWGLSFALQLGLMRSPHSQSARIIPSEPVGVRTDNELLLLYSYNMLCARWTCVCVCVCGGGSTCLQGLNK